MPVRQISNSELLEGENKCVSYQDDDSSATHPPFPGVEGIEVTFFLKEELKSANKNRTV